MYTQERLNTRNGIHARVQGYLDAEALVDDTIKRIGRLSPLPAALARLSLLEALQGQNLPPAAPGARPPQPDESSNGHAAGTNGHARLFVEPAAGGDNPRLRSGPTAKRIEAFFQANGNKPSTTTEIAAAVGRVVKIVRSHLMLMEGGDKRVERVPSDTPSTTWRLAPAA